VLSNSLRVEASDYRQFGGAFGIRTQVLFVFNYNVFTLHSLFQGLEGRQFLLRQNPPSSL